MTYALAEAAKSIKTAVEEKHNIYFANGKWSCHFPFAILIVSWEVEKC